MLELTLHRESRHLYNLGASKTCDQATKMEHALKGWSRGVLTAICALLETGVNIIFASVSAFLHRHTSRVIILRRCECGLSRAVPNAMKCQTVRSIGVIETQWMGTHV
jgi:hypothetical protein